MVYLIPDSVSTLTAVSALVQGLTAVSFMEEAYNVQKDDIILIHTVAGGLGLLMTQLAKSRGATVIGTTSTPEKAALAKANGADHVILYKNEDTVARVLEITNGEGVHAVFDGVGKDTWVKLLLHSSCSDLARTLMQVRLRLFDAQAKGHSCVSGQCFRSRSTIPSH
jgi:NADPH:quinone reductase